MKRNHSGIEIFISSGLLCPHLFRLLFRIFFLVAQTNPRNPAGTLKTTKTARDILKLSKVLGLFFVKMSVHFCRYFVLRLIHLCLSLRVNHSTRSSKNASTITTSFGLCITYLPSRKEKHKFTYASYYEFVCAGHSEKNFKKFPNLL